ncbi:hypothetical protein ACIRL2_28010 [Embleya sp. NPDC127516]|uniref:hypothetical protein n=1 Tax=Embleya sp. NPDC127516 TaxID=3363990 RepID=UPI0038027CB6
MGGGHVRGPEGVGDQWGTLAHGQVRAYALPAVERERDDPRRPAFAARHGFDVDRPVQ